MVDRPARELLAEKLRHFVAGQITVDEFSGAINPVSADAGVRELGWFGDSLHNEVGTSRLRGRLAPTPEEKATAVRAIVFLHSDLEYEWPPSPSGCLPTVCLYSTGMGVALVALALGSARATDGSAALFVFLAAPLLAASGLAYLAGRWAGRRFERRGDFDVWPFLRRSDLEEAARRPRLFAGKLPPAVDPSHAR